MNIVVFYAILCSWIVLFDAPLYSAGGLALGSRFLQLMDLCEELASPLYQRETEAMRAGKNAWDALQMADSVCERAGLEPLSNRFRALADILANVETTGLDADGNVQSALHWFAVDGQNILRRCLAAPQTLFALPPQSSMFGRLPTPPIRWNDNFEQPGFGGMQRVGTQFLWSMQKELLFGACRNHETLRGGAASDCLYGDDCIFRGPSEHRKYVSFLIDSAY